MAASVTFIPDTRFATPRISQASTTPASIATRNDWSPAPDSLPYRGSWRAAGIATRRISELLAGLFGAVEPCAANAAAFGHELRHLLLLACMEVEAAWRGVLEANGPALPQRTTTRDYVRLLGPMRLDEWRLRLALYDEWDEIVPFAGWDPDNATQSLLWYDAYNHTKHDRETNLGMASMRNVISAVAALHVMMWAQFGEGSLQAFGLPAIGSFEVVQRPSWRPEELYFGGKDATPTARPLW